MSTEPVALLLVSKAAPMLSSNPGKAPLEKYGGLRLPDMEGGLVKKYPGPRGEARAGSDSGAWGNFTPD